MVSNAGYSGEYDKNPFDFKHMNLNYLEVTVDGQTITVNFNAINYKSVNKFPVSAKEK